MIPDRLSIRFLSGGPCERGGVGWGGGGGCLGKENYISSKMWFYLFSLPGRLEARSGGGQRVAAGEAVGRGV